MDIKPKSLHVNLKKIEVVRVVLSWSYQKDEHIENRSTSSHLLTVLNSGFSRTFKQKPLEVGKRPEDSHEEHSEAPSEMTGSQGTDSCHTPHLGSVESGE